MFDSAISAVIWVDTDSQSIHFYADVSGNSPSHLVANCSSQPFDDAFYEKLGRILKSYKQKNPDVLLTKVSFLLPDHMFFTDAVTVPALGKKATENSLNLAIGAIYKNKTDLKINTYSLMQNKQSATFGLVGVRKELLSRLNEVCNANQVGIQNVTFVSNAAVNGALAINSKLKNSTFLLLDIKETAARLIFVNKGRTLGSYSLPFGHSSLYKNRLASEDLLFDHSSGELLVLNAKERAKAKQLTINGEEVFIDDDAQDLMQVMELPSELESNDYEEEISYDKPQQKAGRKLPKFMLRDTPADQMGFVFENFRIFMKWTLDLIAGNPDITSLGEIDTVYVNLPRTFNFLYDMANQEQDENKVKFAPLLAGASFDSASAYARDLELMGGFYVRQYNKINNF